MISVCMATYNGEKYVKEQIDSILCQLSNNDELIISDDHSTDSTVEVIKSYQDTRIRLFYNTGIKGCTHNFENALKQAKGDFIFLADQDDVWLSNKLEIMVSILSKEDCDLVMCNCSLTDESLNIVKDKIFDKSWPMQRSIISNFYKCACLGCCIAFTKRALMYFLPFPAKIPMHDIWIYMFTLINLKYKYCDTPLILYRRHKDTVTFAGKKNTNSLYFKIISRLYLLYYLISRSFKFKIKNL